MCLCVKPTFVSTARAHSPPPSAGLNGQPGSVRVWRNPAPSTTWVINLGMQQFAPGAMAIVKACLGSDSGSCSDFMSVFAAAPNC